MGSFSWLYAEKQKDHQNMLPGDEVFCLIPAEFGGGYIKGEYQDYGILFGQIYDNSGIRVHEHKIENETIHLPDLPTNFDLYELLALWNAPEEFESIYSIVPHVMCENYKTDDNRNIGITIGCFDKDHAKLQFPLKILPYAKKYEDVEGFSKNDPNQGFYPWSYNEDDDEDDSEGGYYEYSEDDYYINYD